MAHTWTHTNSTQCSVMYAVLVLLLYISPKAYSSESILLRSSESQNLFVV